MAAERYYLTDHRHLCFGFSDAKIATPNGVWAQKGSGSVIWGSSVGDWGCTVGYKKTFFWEGTSVGAVKNKWTMNVYSLLNQAYAEVCKMRVTFKHVTHEISSLHVIASNSH
jgi:hypothetical protein